MGWNLTTTNAGFCTWNRGMLGTIYTGRGVLRELGLSNWKYSIFLFYFLKLRITLERGQSCLIGSHRGRSGWGSEDIWCAAIVKKGCRILSSMKWWIFVEMCSKPVMKCLPDQPLKTLLTLYHAEHTVSLLNQWWAGRTSCLKSDFYINLMMLWSLTHGCWTLSLCCSL